MNIPIETLTYVTQRSPAGATPFPQPSSSALQLPQWQVAEVQSLLSGDWRISTGQTHRKTLLSGQHVGDVTPISEETIFFSNSGGWPEWLPFLGSAMTRNWLWKTIISAVANGAGGNALRDQKPQGRLTQSWKHILFLWSSSPPSPFLPLNSFLLILPAFFCRYSHTP